MDARQPWRCMHAMWARPSEQQEFVFQLAATAVLVRRPTWLVAHTCWKAADSMSNTSPAAWHKVFEARSEKKPLLMGLIWHSLVKFVPAAAQQRNQHGRANRGPCAGKCTWLHTCTCTCTLAALTSEKGIQLGRIVHTAARRRGNPRRQSTLIRVP